MAEVHILNVGQGDCNIIRSNSGRVTMFDICGANKEITPATEAHLMKNVRALLKKEVKGNFRMCDHPTNPIEFIQNKMGLDSIFRFILSHPDMDHMDGFNNLLDQIEVGNFWDSGVRKEKPDFSQGSPYKAADWDRYIKVRDGKENVTVVHPKAGAENKYFNIDDDGNHGGDYINICAPSDELVENANSSQSGDAINDASYMIVYRSAGGNILFPGDAHDETWEFALKEFGPLLKDCKLMLAPHHGRDSNRSWKFLDKIKPCFSILGCASSKHLAYEQWNRRNLKKITQNQAGNIAVYPYDEGLHIYIENDTFAKKSGGDTSKVDKYGNFYLTTIE